MAKIRERIAYLEAQEKAAEEKRERRNQLMRSDLNTQVGDLNLVLLLSIPLRGSSGYPQRRVA